MTDEQTGTEDFATNFDIPEGWSQVVEGMWQEGDRFYNWDDGFWDRLIDGCHEFVNEYECVIRPNKEEENYTMMTDEEIAAKMPAGYYRVDEGEYKEGDLVVFTTASKLGFSPVSYTHVGCEICAPYVVARPMKGYKPEPEEPPLFPTGAEARKEYPVGTFIRDYFPHAIAALSHHSYKAQQQHGPATNGAPMEWLKEKSVGDGNQMTRHFMERDNVATAWRALEILERELTK